MHLNFLPLTEGQQKVQETCESFNFRIGRQILMKKFFNEKYTNLACFFYCNVLQSPSGKVRTKIPQFYRRFFVRAKTRHIFRYRQLCSTFSFPFSIRSKTPLFPDWQASTWECDWNSHTTQNTWRKLWTVSGSRMQSAKIRRFHPIVPCNPRVAKTNSSTC